MSILREYVCDVTGYAYGKSDISVTSRSSSSTYLLQRSFEKKGIRRKTRPTLSWSPSNSARKLACVPVVPLTPRKPRSSRARLMLRRSQSSSFEVTKYR